MFLVRCENNNTVNNNKTQANPQTRRKRDNWRALKPIKHLKHIHTHPFNERVNVYKGLCVQFSLFKCSGLTCVYFASLCRTALTTSYHTVFQVLKHRILWKLSLRKFPVIDETIYIWMATYPYYPVDHLFGYLMCGKKHLIKLTINDVN